jgi:hypothetical protein
MAKFVGIAKGFSGSKKEFGCWQELLFQNQKQGER